MKIKIVSALLLFCGLFSANAQTDILKGRILNSENGEPVPFANIVLPGTTHGTSSDIDGNFSITVSGLMKTLSLKVSAVGFSTHDIDIAGAMAEGGQCIVNLEPVVYRIADVDVYGESMRCRRIIRLAVENISANYITVPYNYAGYFIEKNVAGGGERFREADVLIYSSGYRRSDPQTAFGDVCYRFREARRNFKVESAYDGLALFDDILAADVVRNVRNVLDYENIEAYSLKDLGETEFEGRRVQVIGFAASKPSLANAGMANAESYSGEIYVDAENYAVLHYHAVLRLSGKSYLGYDYAAGVSKSPVNLDVTVSYRPCGQKYALSGVMLSDGEKQIRFITTGIVTDNPEVVSGRTYFENSELNAPFWESYSVTGI